MQAATAPLELINPQLALHLFQRDAFGFRHHEFYPHKLQHHHAAEKEKNIAGRERLDNLREKCREQRGKNPVRETSQSLAWVPLKKGIIRDFYRESTTNLGGLFDRPLTGVAESDLKKVQGDINDIKLKIFSGNQLISASAPCFSGGSM